MRETLVTFKLIDKREEKLIFWYYPEGNEDKRPGNMVVDRLKEKIDITEVAEDDLERDILPEEIRLYKI